MTRHYCRYDYTYSVTDLLLLFLKAQTPTRFRFSPQPISFLFPWLPAFRRLFLPVPEAEAQESLMRLDSKLSAELSASPFVADTLAALADRRVSASEFFAESPQFVG